MLFIFDMGGVVTSTFSENSLCDFLKIDLEKFSNICKYEYDIFSELTKGQIDTKKFWQIFNERIKNDKSLSAIYPIKNDLFRLIFHPKLNNKTIKIIQALKKKHRVVCGTNTIQSHYENHLERGDYSFFDKTYASNKIEEEKPNENFFKIILKAENYKPEETFFVDDRIENVNAAQKFGINAIQFTTADELKKAWKKYF